MKLTYARYLRLVMAGINTTKGLDPDDAYKVAQALRDSLAAACAMGGGDPARVVVYLEAAEQTIVDELSAQPKPVFE